MAQINLDQMATEELGLLLQNEYEQLMQRQNNIRAITMELDRRKGTRQGKEIRKTPKKPTKRKVKNGED